MMKLPAVWIVVAILSLDAKNANASFAFIAPSIKCRRPTAWTNHRRAAYKSPSTTLYSSGWNDDSQDSNKWRSADEESNIEEQEDWEDVLNKKTDGSFWSQFDPIEEDSSSSSQEEIINKAPAPEEVTEADAWLDTLASLQAEEVEFNMKEADRADKVRQMQEWGFENQVIANTLGVSLDSSLEGEEIEGMQQYRQESYIEDEDLSLVESHAKVEKDPDTGEPLRSQMVYVDEHTCIGCTNCAMIAQSTFFMDQEHGRARVFNQWGDDDETIQIAIETCPVDCIHYVPYEELVKLEEERRDQNINFKARLVSQAEYGGVGGSNMVGGANKFTAPQQISGNMGSRCNNCPSAGCKNCPMYGVGKNPEFERKEQQRKARAAKRRLQQERERDMKSADL